MTALPDAVIASANAPAPGAGSQTGPSGNVGNTSYTRAASKHGGVAQSSGPDRFGCGRDGRRFLGTGTARGFWWRANVLLQFRRGLTRRRFDGRCPASVARRPSVARHRFLLPCSPTAYRGPAAAAIDVFNLTRSTPAERPHQGAPLSSNRGRRPLARVLPPQRTNKSAGARRRRERALRRR